jgi:hypothetical protein
VLLSGKFLYDSVHFFPMCFHIGRQLELGMGTIQILICVAYVETVVTGQEADAALQSHPLCTPGQVLQISLGQTAPGAPQEAPGVDKVSLMWPLP